METTYSSPEEGGITMDSFTTELLTIAKDRSSLLQSPLVNELKMESSRQSEHEEVVVIEETVETTVFAPEYSSQNNPLIHRPTLIPILQPNHHSLQQSEQQRSPSLKSPEEGFIKRLRWSRLVKSKTPKTVAQNDSEWVNSPASYESKKRLSIIESIKTGDDDEAVVNRFVIARDLFIGFTEGFTMPFILAAG
jgi:hypothetical protein